MAYVNADVKVNETNFLASSHYISFTKQVDDTNYAVHTPTRMLELVTNSADYMELKNEALKNSGLSTNRMYPQEVIDQYRNATDRTKYPNYDWIDLMFNPALAYSHNLNVNGGGEKTAYNTSLGYSNQDGVMRGFNNQRVNFSINTKTDK